MESPEGEWSTWLSAVQLRERSRAQDHKEDRPQADRRARQGEGQEDRIQEGARQEEKTDQSEEETIWCVVLR